MPDDNDRIGTVADHDDPPSVERCRELLRDGGYPEHELSDREVRKMRDDLAGLLELLMELSSKKE